MEGFALAAAVRVTTAVSEAAGTSPPAIASTSVTLAVVPSSM